MRPEKGGKVKQGLVYRSFCFDYYKSDDSHVVVISNKGKETVLNQLGIKTEIDLRGEYPTKDASVLGEGVNLFYCPLNYQADLLSQNKTSIKKFFDYLADESNYPVTYHCQAGADRTGIITYLLNGLLGVDREDLLRDYLITNFSNVDCNFRPLSSISGRYVKTLDEYDNGAVKLSERIYHYLNNEVGVSTQNLDFIIQYLTD